MRTAHLFSLLLLCACPSRFEKHIESMWGKMTFTTPHGIKVYRGVYPVDPVLFSAHVAWVLNEWQKALDSEGEPCDVQRMVWGTRVAFLPHPFQAGKDSVPKASLDAEGGGAAWLSGLAFEIAPSVLPGRASWMLLVGHENQLAKTALAHEIGHVIAKKCLGLREHDQIDAFVKPKGVPF